MKALPIFLCVPLISSVTSPAMELGELVVEGLKPDITHRITSEEIRDFERNTLAESLDLLPGVSMTRVGGRSESMVTVRGFDLRQVPLHIDGIPVYVPYDGYADLGRFLMPDSGEIEVAKGLSPVLAGPNALGGLINVFTRRPTEKLEGSLHAGAFSGDGWKAGLSAGGREEKGYWQLNASWLQQDAFPLSGDFKSHPNENGGRRNNSWREDWHLSGRVAWTPAADDEYALGFWSQRGEKGTPPYAGNDPTVAARFWQWPQWDKDTFYLFTRTSLGPDTKLETKWHYDRFENLLRSFDDATYSTQTRGYAFDSYYDDWIAGTSATLENRSLKNTRLAAAIHYQRDHHEETAPGEPVFTFEDETLSLGVEAEYDFGHGRTLTGGLSHDRRDIREAVDTNTGNSIDASGTASWNPQLVYRQQFDDHLEGHFGIARKSRFPTIKDRYSYRMGQAIPNPDLDPETVTHFDLGLGGKLADSRIEWKAGLFYSRIEDAIQRVDNAAFTSGGSGLFQLQNVGEVEHRGFEFALASKWTDTLSTGMNYAWTTAENRTAPEIHVPNIPEHEILLFAKLNLHERFRLIPSFTWTDSRMVSSNGKSVGTYASVDLKAETKLPGDVTLGFGVTNLLDRDQMLDEGYPEPGRVFFANLRYTF
ncbi:MAG: TonB-dependent receptor [Luteolibacter sp.]